MAKSHTTNVRGVARQIEDLLPLGSSVLALVELKCTTHTENEDGSTAQTILVSDLYRVDDDKDAKKLLKKVRAVVQVEKDEKAGRVPAGAWTEQAAQYLGTTDGSGVVMTLREIAEARGQTWSEEDTFVIEFVGGQRGHWPDEFPAQELAAPGGMMLIPGGEAAERGQVVAFISIETGKPFDTWTPEDEAERLLVLEQEAIVAEAEAAEAAASASTSEAPPATGELDDVATIADEPIGKLNGNHVVAHVRGCVDLDWLELALATEKAGKGRKTVVKAIEARIASGEAGKVDADGFFEPTGKPNLAAVPDPE